VLILIIGRTRQFMKLFSDILQNLQKFVLSIIMYAHTYTGKTLPKYRIYNFSKKSFIMFLNITNRQSEFKLHVI
jgi:hypothetical protein